MSKRNSRFKEMSDEDIVAEYQSTRNEDIAEYMLKRYRPYLKSKVRNYFLAGGEDDDIYQEASLGLYKALRDYQPDKGIFRAFADLCITRQVITAVKASTRQKHAALNTAVSLQKPVCDREDTDRLLIEMVTGEWSESPEEQFFENMVRKDLLTRCFEMTSKFETDLLRLYLEGYSYAEIAEKLDKNIKVIDNTLQRVKKKVQLSLGVMEP